LHCIDDRNKDEDATDEVSRLSKSGVFFQV